MGRTEKSDEGEKKAAYGCELAPPLPSGLVLTDVRTNKWCLGKAIRSGAFGDVYLASRGEKPAGSTAKFVVKLEPHANGPLFTEMHFFTRVGLPEHRENWCGGGGRAKGYVGMPCCHGFGSILFQSQRLRFVVIDRLGSDLDKFFRGGESPFPLATALRVAVQVLECLEFIHSKNYVHNDIKAQNLLLGYGAEENVFLVDFGLACKYRNNYGFHKPHEPDERRAHDGTLEYTSLDAHIGAHSRRGDLETLGYNLVHWVSGGLPWLKDMNPEVPELVENQKKLYMSNVATFLAKCFQPPEEPPVVLEEYLNYVMNMDFDTSPDYEYVKTLFTDTAAALGKEGKGKLVWSKPAPKKRGGSRKVKRGGGDDDNARTGFDDEASQGVEDFTIDESSRGGEDSTRKTRSKIEEGTHDSWNWEDVLKQNPEDIGRGNKTEEVDTELTAREEDFTRRQLDSLSNPTPEMCRIMAQLTELAEERRAMSLKDQLSEFNKQRKAELVARFSSQDLEPCENTPAMLEVISKRAERMSRNVPSPEDSEGFAPAADTSQEHRILMEKVQKYVRRMKKEKGKQGKQTTPTVNTRTNKTAGKKTKLIKKGGKAKAKPASTSPADGATASITGALEKVAISTRARRFQPAASGAAPGARSITRSTGGPKASSALEKSKSLVKKAVKKSMELKSKVSPKMFLRTRTRALARAGKKEAAKEEESKMDVDQTEKEGADSVAKEKADEQKSVEDSVEECMEPAPVENIKTTEDEAVVGSKRPTRATRRAKEKALPEDRTTGSDASKKPEDTTKSDLEEGSVETKEECEEGSVTAKTPDLSSESGPTEPEKELSKLPAEEKEVVTSPVEEEPVVDINQLKLKIFSEKKPSKDEIFSSLFDEKPTRKLSDRLMSSESFTSPSRTLDEGSDSGAKSPGETSRPSFQNARETEKLVQAKDLSPAVTTPSCVPEGTSGLPSATSTLPNFAFNKSPTTSGLFSSPSFPGIGTSYLGSSPATAPLQVDTSSVRAVTKPMFSPDDTPLFSTGPDLMDSDSNSSGLDPSALDRILSVLSPHEEEAPETDVAGPHEGSSNSLETKQPFPTVADHSRPPQPIMFLSSKDPGSSTSTPLLSTVSTSVVSTTAATTVSSVPTPGPSVCSPVVSAPPLLSEVLAPSAPPTISTIAPVLTNQPAAIVTTTSLTTASTSVSTVTTNSLPTIKISAVSPNIKDISIVKRKELQGPDSEGSIFDIDHQEKQKSPRQITSPLAINTGNVSIKVTEQKEIKVVIPKKVIELSKQKHEAKSPQSCEHYPNEESMENSEDFKSLSRSFSSIKQRLKSLAKDMYTPVAKKVDGKHLIPMQSSPLTLKISKSSDGRWTTTPSATPDVEKPKLILHISKTGMKTPKIRIKPIRRAQTELCTKRNKRSRKETALTSTPTTSFVPEGWVSFDEVQAKMKESTVETPEAPTELKPSLEKTDSVEIVENKSSSLKIRSDLLSPPCSQPTPVLKPKISLRTDLFAVKPEVSSPDTLSDNSILKSKLLAAGRRNLMNSIDTLAKPVSQSSSKLVVLNPVTENLDEYPPPLLESANNKSSQESCYCCPTFFCQFKPVSGLQSEQSLNLFPQTSFKKGSRPTPPVQINSFYNEQNTTMASYLKESVGRNDAAKPGFVPDPDLSLGDKNYVDPRIQLSQALFQDTLPFNLNHVAVPDRETVPSEIFDIPCQNILQRCLENRLELSSNQSINQSIEAPSEMLPDDLFDTPVNTVDDHVLNSIDNSIEDQNSFQNNICNTVDESISGNISEAPAVPTEVVTPVSDSFSSKDPVGQDENILEQATTTENQVENLTESSNEVTPHVEPSSIGQSENTSSFIGQKSTDNDSSVGDTNIEHISCNIDKENNSGEDRLCEVFETPNSVLTENTSVEVTTDKKGDTLTSLESCSEVTSNVLVAELMPLPNIGMGDPPRTEDDTENIFTAADQTVLSNLENDSTPQETDSPCISFKKDKAGNKEVPKSEKFIKNSVESEGFAELDQAIASIAEDLIGDTSKDLHSFSHVESPHAETVSNVPEVNELTEPVGQTDLDPSDRLSQCPDIHTPNTLISENSIVLPTMSPKGQSSPGNSSKISDEEEVVTPDPDSNTNPDIISKVTNDFNEKVVSEPVVLQDKTADNSKQNEEANSVFVDNISGTDKCGIPKKLPDSIINNVNIDPSVKKQKPEVPLSEYPLAMSPREAFTSEDSIPVEEANNTGAVDTDASSLDTHSESNLVNNIDKTNPAVSENSELKETDVGLIEADQISSIHESCKVKSPSSDSVESKVKSPSSDSVERDPGPEVDCSSLENTSESISSSEVIKPGETILDYGSVTELDSQRYASLKSPATLQTHENNISPEDTDTAHYPTLNSNEQNSTSIDVAQEDNSSASTEIESLQSREISPVQVETTVTSLADKQTAPTSSECPTVSNVSLDNEEAICEESACDLREMENDCSIANDESTIPCETSQTLSVETLSTESVDISMEKGDRVPIADPDLVQNNYDSIKPPIEVSAVSNHVEVMEYHMERDKCNVSSQAEVLKDHTESDKSNVSVVISSIEPQPQIVDSEIEQINSDSKSPEGVFVPNTLEGDSPKHRDPESATSPVKPCPRLKQSNSVDFVADTDVVSLIVDRDNKDETELPESVSTLPTDTCSDDHVSGEPDIKPSEKPKTPSKVASLQSSETVDKSVLVEEPARLSETPSAKSGLEEDDSEKVAELNEGVGLDTSDKSLELEDEINLEFDNISTDKEDGKVKKRKETVNYKEMHTGKKTGVSPQKPSSPPKAQGKRVDPLHVLLKTVELFDKSPRSVVDKESSNSVTDLETHPEAKNEDLERTLKSSPKVAKPGNPARKKKKKIISKSQTTPGKVVKLRKRKVASVTKNNKILTRVPGKKGVVTDSSSELPDNRQQALTGEEMATGASTPFKKPKVGAAPIGEKRDSTDLKQLSTSPTISRKRRDSTSSATSDASVRSRHGSNSSNASDISTNSSTTGKEKPRSKTRMLDILEPVPIISRRHGRKCRAKEGGGEATGAKRKKLGGELKKAKLMKSGKEKSESEAAGAGDETRDEVGPDDKAEVSVKAKTVAKLTSSKAAPSKGSPEKIENSLKATQSKQIVKIKRVITVGIKPNKKVQETGGTVGDKPRMKKKVKKSAVVLQKTNVDSSEISTAATKDAKQDDDVQKVNSKIKKVTGVKSVKTLDEPSPKKPKLASVPVPADTHVTGSPKKKGVGGATSPTKKLEGGPSAGVKVGGSGTKSASIIAKRKAPPPTAAKTADNDETDPEDNGAETEDEAETAMTQVHVDDEITLTISEASLHHIKSPDKKSPAGKKKKLLLKKRKLLGAKSGGGSGEADAAVGGAAGAKAKLGKTKGGVKKKSVVMRKGRSGANTRSTNLQL